MNVREGHFIKEDLACFDATFFSMTPAEAECVDPQQRWLLETTYHALENGRSHRTYFDNFTLVDRPITSRNSN